MPNQRHADRRQLAAWMFEKDLNRLKWLATKEGKSLPETIVALVDEYMAKHFPLSVRQNPDTFDSKVGNQDVIPCLKAAPPALRNLLEETLMQVSAHEPEESA